MDINLQRANFIFKINDLEEITYSDLHDVIDSLYQGDNSAGIENKRFILLINILAKNLGSSYDETKMEKYLRDLIRNSSQYLGITLTTHEIEVIMAYILQYRYSILTGNSINNNETLYNKLLSYSKELQTYNNKNEVMFYVIYKINSGLLEYYLSNLTVHKALAYQVSDRMNKYSNYFSQISVEGF